MTELNEAFDRINSEMAKISGEAEILREELAATRAVMDYDERGWISLSTQGSDKTGLSLSQLKDHSESIREYVVINPLIGRGAGLRYSYVWSKGVEVPGVNEQAGKRRGAPSKLERFYRNPVNQENVFSDHAHQKMELSVFTDGAYLLLGNNETKELRPIPISEVAGIYVNPEFSGEVWAVLREWTPDPSNPATRRRWYYSDKFTGTRRGSITDDAGKSVPVESRFTLIDMWVNRQVGWALGVPDAMAAMPWVRTYTELVMNGKTMTDALARFASKVKVGSQKGAGNVGVKMGGSGAGQAAVIGEGNEMDIFSSAGKTYDFNGVRPIAALVATALEVSIIHLLSDPGAAGSSYGSASNLDLPTKRAMVARQNMWKSFLERVIEWGTEERLNVSFPSLDDPDPYRESQVVALAWNSGTVHADEVRPRFMEIANISARHDSAPENVLQPNNSDSWERSDIDPSDDPTTSTASPDQGQSNGTGGTDSGLANDERTDNIGEAVNRMANLEILEKMESLVSRMEELSK